MVELNLEEQVQRIVLETGIPSVSSESQQEAEAAKAAAEKSGMVYTSMSLSDQMPECIEVTEPMELEHMKPVYFKC